MKKGIDTKKKVWYNKITIRVATNAEKERKTKMTTRDFLNAVISTSSDNAVIDEAKTRLAEMNDKNTARKVKSLEEDAPLFDAIGKVLSSTPKTSTQIANEVGISGPKAIALLKKMEGITIGETVVNKRVVKTYAVMA